MRALCLASVFVLVGCGGDDDAAPDTTDTGAIPVDSGTDSGAIDSAKPDTTASGDTLPDVTPDTTPGGDAAGDGEASIGDADAGCPTAWMTAPTVDSSIAVPSDGGSLLLHAFGTGTQNYSCLASTSAGDAGADADAADGDAADTAVTTYTWTLTAPEADLKNCASVKIGTHFASAAGASAPEWMTTDGTYVIASRKMAYTADAATIPWLLLQTTSHGGTGTLAKTLYIQRTNTTAGKAPATGCDASSVGATTKVAYTADYWFFGTP